MKKKDKEELIKIHEEAYYRAIKRLNGEQGKGEDNKKVEEKRKWYEETFFILNIIFCPWKINTRFQVNNQIYDGILVFFVSFILEASGTIVWGAGFLAAARKIIMQMEEGLYFRIIETVVLGALAMIFGSLLILSGKEFSKVTDSNKIYAYSSSLIALISCVIALISVIL